MLLETKKLEISIKDITENLRSPQIQWRPISKRGK